MTRPRVLLIAEAANPEWVSVPLVGWSHARAIAKVADAHVVTQVRNREAWLRAGMVEGRDFTAIDSEAVAARVHRAASLLRGGSGKGWTTEMALVALGYPYFEKQVWDGFGRRIRDGEFDLVHRLTPLSPTVASPIAAKCKAAGMPFVLGPLNGGVPWPRQFDAARRMEKEWLSYVREAYKLMPGFHATRRSASAILIGSRDTWKQMPRSYHSKCFYVPENAIDPERFALRRTRPASNPVRAVFVGRLVPYKGADMLLEAAAPLVRAGRIMIDVIGDGPQMPELRAFVEREGLSHGVNLAGWVEHAKVPERMARCDVLAFPSVREFGGGVALEAMALGVVPIVVDYGGPAELVTEKTGYLVPMGSREQIVHRFRTLLAELSDNAERIEAKSAAALHRAHGQFTWDAKAQQVMEVYRWVLGQGPKPEVRMPLPDC